MIGIIHKIAKSRFCENPDFRMCLTPLMSCLEFNFKLRYTQTNIYGVLLYRVTLVHYPSCIIIIVSVPYELNHELVELIF